MRVTLVHNPEAGNGTVSAEHLLDLLAEAGHEVRYQSSKKKGIKRALEEPAEIVIAAGGDGTVDKVLRRMAGRDTPIAILPLGTANNVATALDVRGPTETLIAGWPEARPRPFDVGVAQGPWGRRLFLEGVGLGALAAGAAPLDEQQPTGTRRRKLAVARDAVREAIRRHAGVRVRAELDGSDGRDGRVLEGRYVLVEALNIGRVGPSLRLGPEADPSDGLLDLVVVPEQQRAALVGWLDADGEQEQAPPPIEIRRCRSLRLESTATPLRIGDEFWDGEAGAGEASPPWRAEIALLPGAVRVLVPRVDEQPA